VLRPGGEFDCSNFAPRLLADTGDHSTMVRRDTTTVIVATTRAPHSDRNAESPLIAGAER
jgi:hypothetical protein